ncbi:1-(5-phosphoribosyl)-5-[(5-phosphoribosylamino)methylideneamino] imidazole-4-carboxamide isomerase [Zymomonas mobilis]|uniref:1-(5-phosphoribosyl)-5-[(5- phosphoribosylamino)methylideneamino]imidazole-4- carboxamide isomerase n=1 Tax=Zymomonas mobilis TaxID=542 RepID=UPI00026D7EB8|nr:1-(5-phosphoribosyl)-5-[(5-phosphoribosylamino)methylideneamino]imidazole-4-carboxamide isomerase [Zymomonas mobilis]AFN57452.1 1-(5-phosphoribosyl)-5-((5-phosphoribosylamino)methylideneamino) imidazole-4-carboxamide isomerase [Zymomonas mobilis subsp. mobilis ATCC 29191]TQK78786.1 1-(5-phosphoribosyl)-5-[(5-phosphoribosylamino)methylideneamino] imidazole-4-carboxamide isomerase [Zymomonas mobilis]TQL16012.1 1-(5-phosphoribosyl)-5-[(5-phosphoribosylamino)methylideneamino] imidazole-4-carboxam
MTDSLIIFPAIDLKEGHVVRLSEGDMDRATIYDDDPAARACQFYEAGARYLHVVDLDGAFAGHAMNAAAVDAIVKAFPGTIELGGGIRDMKAIDGWLSRGISRVVIGTAAFENPDLVKEAARKYPGQIVVAVDARDGMVTTKGWAEQSEISVTDMAERFADAGVVALLYTDVGRDGLKKGCNSEATLALAAATDIPVIASGGVKDIGDIELLARHTKDGIEGVICGRAIYDGSLDLKAALAIARQGGASA